MTGPNIDLSQATDIICDNCGNYTFTNVFVMKKISALQIGNPTGKEGVVPVPTFACNACGFINQQFLPTTKREAPVEGEAESAADISAQAAIERNRGKIL